MPSKHLLVDIGNTSVKWALWDGRQLCRPGAAKHHGALPIDLLAAWESLTGIAQLVVACVGPRSVLDAVAAVARASWQCGVRVVETRASAHGVRIAYAQPARLGVDRFLALVGAQHAGPPGDKVIVDAGTAVTYDLLDAAGRHLGGLILPGVQMMRDSLLTGTLIPRHESADGNQSWAADTGEAIAAASIQAPAALAERLLDRLAQETGNSPCLIITGGDAERLLPAIDRPAVHQPDLVLQGLSRFV
ncbi:type III pantothenate kinase [Thiohalocapsa marina]|uniref:Type III pantothenate kinase n=1 Tax=Thiohalocapsa marina TaxID=424902 RepID=A0A5M8FSH3_9GAMM|nr:type III pantothenate kinase [Thiohalocapsa marina]KAA6185062.1 type III pantothenate kinase [Thiohalocapsa marina]